MKYGIVLLEKYGIEGLNRKDVINLFDMLNKSNAFPIELEARKHESSAMGFITPEAAEVFDYDYESSGLHDFISEILDDMKNESENYTYVFKGVNIWLSR